MMSCRTALFAAALLIALSRTPSLALRLQEQAAPAPAQSAPDQKGPSEVPAEIPEVQEDDAYVIYSMLVPKEFEADKDPSEYTQWLISAQTIQWPAAGDENKLETCVHIPDAEKAQFESMLADYKRQNAGPKRLATRFRLPKMYSLLSDTGKDSYLAATEPAEGRRRPRKIQSWLEGAPGVISFSAIGFSSDHSLALVYAEHECGTDCGGGSPHVLKKVNGTWQEQKVVSCRWVAS